MLLVRVYVNTEKRTYSEDGDVDVATTDHAEGFGRVEDRSTRDEGHSLLASIHNIARGEVSDTELAPKLSGALTDQPAPWWDKGPFPGYRSQTESKLFGPLAGMKQRGSEYLILVSNPHSTSRSNHLPTPKLT